MIKKINQLIDDMPFIIKLILGIIMTGIITLCFFIIGVVQVDAASIDYDNTSNYIHKKSPTAEWLNFSRATDYSLSSTAVYDQVNIQWTNYQGGVANGVVVMTITGGTITSSTCGQLYSAFSVKENGTDTGATITRTECLVNSTSATVRIGFVTSVLGTNSYLEVQFRKEFMLATKINAYGVMTVKQIDPATNTDIQDQTNALINNNNSNTQIITNAVENSTTNIINQMQDNLNMCDNYNYNKGPVGLDNKQLNLNGTITDNNSYQVSEYIKVSKNETYTIEKTNNFGTSLGYCFYTNDKTLINCIAYGTSTEISLTPQYDGYIRYTYNKGGNTTFIFKGKYCQDRTQAEIDELQQLRSQLMHSGEWEEEDDEVKNGLLRNIISGIGNIFGFLGDDELDDPDDALSDLSSNMGTNNVISSLLLLPVSIYQSVVNNINGTCNSFNLGSLYNHNLTMTCIRPQDYLGSALWGVIDVIISGIFVLHIRKKFVDIFNHFTSLRTGGNELE